MTNEEAMQFYNELVKEYGDKLPNPEHYPKTFQYYVKLYLYYRQHNPKNETANS